MSTDRIIALEQRLATLERERRVSAGLVVLSLVLLVASQTTRPHAQGTPETKIKAPFQVVNNRGETIFSVETTGTETKVNVVDANGAVASLSGSKEGSSLFLSGKQALARIAVDFDGPGTGPSILMKDSDGEVLTVGSKAASLQAPLRVTTGDSGKTDALEIVGSMSILDSKGRRGASISPTAVRVHGGDGVVSAASLGVDDAGRGRLVVGAPNGVRGVLGHPQAGGISFALFDGTKPRVSMLAAPNSSTVGVYTGKRSAELNVGPASSHLNMHNDEGFAAASLSTSGVGSGSLELSNAAGDMTVQAGMTTDGLGVVRAGPRVGGVVGFEGSLPWAILGKRLK